MATTFDLDIQKLQLLQAAKFLHAYIECSDSIQAEIRELLEVVEDPDTDEDDREMTLFTLADALFPNPHEGELGMDLEQSEKMGADYSEEMRQAVEEMDREEAAFAERLRAIMEHRGVTQQTLAERLGIGQSAISNMLNRQCRPQRRTVARFAKALDVSPSELWPEVH
jgi:lambda repressor-like predicted transcriptional regulator